MSLTNFSFPSVTFRQSYAETSANTDSTLSVACVGQQFLYHDASGANAYQLGSFTYNPTSSSTATLTKSSKAVSIDTDAKYLSLVVRDGVFSYYTTTAVSSTGTSVASRKIVFTENVIAGDGASAAAGFGTRGAKVGDTVIVTSSGSTTVQATILKIEGTDTVYVSTLGSLSDVASVKFCDTQDAVYTDGLSISGTATITLTVAGNRTSSVDGVSGVVTSPTIRLEGGTFYIEFRELMGEYIGKLGTVATASEVMETLGTPCAANPLALCCYFAVLAGNNTPVHFTCVESNTATNYATALDYLANFDNVYSIVPACDDKYVIQQCAASCISVSSNEESTIRRALWYGITQPAQPELWSGTVSSISSNDVTLSGTVYSTTVLAAGDKLVRVSDGASATITAISGSDTVTVDSASSFSENDAVAIVRTSPSANDLIDAIIAKRCTQSERAVGCWCDGLVFNGEIVPNYALAAAAAGMRAYEPCQRPLSNLSYGFFDVSESNGFTKSQLERIGSNGIWIVANNSDGTPVNKRQITTAIANNLNKDEESIVAVADTIAMDMCQIGRNVVGNSNISKELINYLKLQLDTHLSVYLVNSTENVYIGAPLTEYEIVRVEQDPVNLDRIYASFTCTPPKPFNKFDMNMVIK